MNAILQQRITTLESEHETGRRMLAELDAKRASLTQTLLRIEGAIQVLRELSGVAEPVDLDRSASQGGALAALPP